MPEIRELKSFEDFEDAIHNGPTKDFFNISFCLLEEIQWFRDSMGRTTAAFQPV